MALATILAIGVTPAWAHISPANCNSSQTLTFEVFADKTLVSNGDTVTFRAVVSNVNSGSRIACDVTDAVLTMVLPARDGTATGEVRTIGPFDVPAGTEPTEVGSVAYVVQVSRGVSTIEVHGDVAGEVHNEATARHVVVDRSYRLFLPVSNPHTTLRVAATPDRGLAPLTVTYTYRETNDGTDPISNVVITDDMCSPVTYVRGDVGNDDILSPGETWVYTCTRTFTDPGTYTNRVRGTGTNMRTGEPAPLERASTTVIVEPRSPHTTLRVTAAPDRGLAPLTVTYTYRETNDGTDPISDVVITDDMCSPVNYVRGDEGNDDILSPGETWVYTCTRTFTDPGTYTNQVRGTGTNIITGGPAPLERASTTVRVRPREPHTTLRVSADPSRGDAPLTVTYTYLETNDGTDPISNVVITDDLCEPVTYVSGDTDGDSILDPGETWRYTCTRTFNEPGTYTNHARGTGTNVITGGPAPLELAETTVRVGAPHTTLQVTADPSLGDAPLTVTYTYLETNDGTDPISNVEITDDLCSPVAFQTGDVGGDSILSPGETWRYTCTRTYTAPGTYTNHARGTGTNVITGGPAPLELAETTVRVGAPHTTLQASADPDAGPAPLTVTYTYLETNDGTDPISNVVITDDLCAPVTYVSGDTDGDSILDPGETWRYTCTRTFTDAGRFTSHVRGTGTNVITGAPAPLELAETTVRVQREPPELRPHTTLRVTADPDAGPAPLNVTYTYFETNDGVNAPISNVAVSDDLCSPVTYRSGDANANSILDVGETWTYTCSRTFTEAGTFTNHVTATGTVVATGEAAPLELAETTVRVQREPPEPPQPHTTLRVTAMPDQGYAPFRVTYTYFETNDGQNPISNVVVSDDLCSPVTYRSGDGNANSILDVGETWTYTCTRLFPEGTTPAVYVNHVTATGTDVTTGQPAPLELAQASVTVLLPETGMAVTGLLWVGAACLATGTLLVVPTRRRRHRFTT